LAKNEIVIKGAKENNLKNIDLTLKRDQLIVLTGLSGSGKSSLAFDTIYAEGQRRYVESLSSYARQFLGRMDKPDVEYIEGLSPSISIDQKTTSKNPRSTVGTVTEIYDYLRLLFAKIGIPYCPICGEKIQAQSIDQIIDRVLELPENSRIMVMAPIVREKKGEHVKLLQSTRKEGYLRAMIDGELVELEDEPKLDKNKKHTIEVVIDRIVLREGISSRLTDSMESALKMGDGLARVHVMDGEDLFFSSKLTCPNQHVSIEEITPRLFSFNSPFGMCPECNGLGFSRELDPELILPNLDLSIAEGGIDPFATSKPGTFYYEIFKAIAHRHGATEDTPLKDVPRKMIDEILYGTRGEELKYKFKSHFAGQKTHVAAFEGVIPNIDRRYHQTGSDWMKEKFEDYMVEEQCPACHGKRLKEEVLSIRVGDLNIAEVTDMSVAKAIRWFEALTLSETQRMIGDQVLKEIKERLRFLQNVGLQYLTLSRAAGTLSGGESQRIRLATQIGSSLVGVVYVLDEPSIGLHQRDNGLLLKTLRELTNIGNTLIVVEHDEETMRMADDIVDIGPGAGVHGGEIVAHGTLDEIMQVEESVTGQYLSGKKEIPVPKVRRQPKHWLEVTGARENNLRNIDVSFPTGTLTCVTGVSGSGKSSLVNGILYKELANKLNRAKQRPGKFRSIKGLEYLDKVIDIDQSPIGRTPRSNPATYTGVFDSIRDVFAMTPEAKMRGYQKGRFSFNVKGGRCEACSGDGILKVEMHFLPDVYVPCEVCRGKRYNRETLQILYKGKSIADVLDMTVEEAVEFFANLPLIHRKLKTLYDVGLGYIKLGQSSTELSGGEAQRVKLATELSKRSTGRTVYILDEPTTGLHSADIHKLTAVLDQLVEGGNTVIVIEHNLDVIKTADYIIDLGPEGGDGGGLVIATGTPEEIARVEKSYTGRFLKPILDKHRKRKTNKTK
jgi:excinuclease ABC subunit A